MNKNQTLHDALYDALDVDEKENNPFETDKINKPFETFCAKYIHGTVDKPEDPEDGYCDIVHVIEEAQRNAFKIGFETALALIAKVGV